MRKNKSGRLRNDNRKRMVRALRDDQDLSFAEIGKETGMSRQLARYHYLILDSEKVDVDK